MDKELFRRVHKRTRQRLYMRSGSIANDPHQNGTLWNEGDLIRHTHFILEFPLLGDAVVQPQDLTVTTASTTMESSPSCSI